MNQEISFSEEDILNDRQYLDLPELSHRLLISTVIRTGPRTYKLTACGKGNYKYEIYVVTKDVLPGDITVGDLVKAEWDYVDIDRVDNE